MILQYGKDKPYTGKEDDLQQATAKWLRAQHPDLLAFHVPNGGKRPLSAVRRGGGIVMVPIIAAKLKQGGALAGVSDWLILTPSGHWHGAAIEIKAKGGSLEESQKTFLEKATANNYFTAVAWSLDGFMDAVGEFLTAKINTDQLMAEVSNALDLPLAQVKMENPFKIGEEAPPEMDEMFYPFTWDAMPDYLDGVDYLTFGIRGNPIPDQETADRLFDAYKIHLSLHPDRWPIKR